MTEPQPATAEALEDCLRRLQAVCVDLDQLAPELSLTERSALPGPRRELAREAAANLAIVRQHMREVALRLDVARTLHQSAVSRWAVDGPVDAQRGDAPSPRTG